MSCTSKQFHFDCQPYPLGKSSHLSLEPMSHKTSAPLELIFSDVKGPSPMLSSDDFWYFVIFVDAHTKYIWFFPLVAKSNVFTIFHQFQTQVERQFSLKIKSVPNRLEWQVSQIKCLFKSIGIHHRLSTHILMNRMTWLNVDTDILLKSALCF